MRVKRSTLFRNFVQEICKCKSCELHKYRRQVVPGMGDIPADILFLGIAPGKSEDLLGEPFVGESGLLLDQMLKDAMKLLHLKRKLRVFKTNSVLCRSAIQDENSDRYGSNCDPTDAQILACIPKIHRLVKIVKPQLIIFLGKVPLNYYGKEYPDAGALQHPAFMLRDGGTASRFYRQNMRKLSEILKELE